MSSNTSCSLMSLFFLLLLLILDSADLTVSSYCLRNCGGIKISYPFGIGMGCYLEHSYEIECVNSYECSISY
ncbi:Wall-associated receptor kinase galacturonan-binding domain, partial [Arabidopsis thaliana x Arabidopsis arenosa]